MASQIAHMVYANEYLQKYPRPKEKEAFIAGAFFPDIRRVSNLTRAQTHQHFTDLDLKFEFMDSFEAGWKFHVWCDLRRNELLRDAGFLQMKEVEGAHYQAYYFLEDELLWSKYQNWETVQNILRDFPFKPLFPQLPKHDWEFWYQLVAEYIGQPPSPESISRFCKQIPSLSLKTQAIIDGMAKLRNNRKVAEILLQLPNQLL